MVIMFLIICTVIIHLNLIVFFKISSRQNIFVRTVSRKNVITTSLSTLPLQPVLLPVTENWDKSSNLCGSVGQRITAASSSPGTGDLLQYITCLHGVSLLKHKTVPEYIMSQFHMSTWPIYMGNWVILIKSGQRDPYFSP